MPIVFFYGSGSPYAWKVWLALEHKRLSCELRVLSFQAGASEASEAGVSRGHRVVLAWT